MSIEQAYSLIANLHEQATGQKVATPTDLSSFISVAQATLVNGYEPVLNAISQVISRTIFAVRPYDPKFKGLEMTTEAWGGIVRKISFVDREPEQDTSYELVDGQSSDQYQIKKPIVVQTVYVGSDVFEDHMTITEKQLQMAFHDPAEFARWMTSLMTHFSNVWTQWKEELARSIVCNAIAAKAQADGNNVVHLVAEYNAEIGGTFTRQDLMKPENIKGFGRWLYARLETLSNQMTERSQLFQMQITGKPITRHTDRVDQRFYISAPIMAIIEAQVNADTYHENFLKLTDNEKVNYWQSILEPEKVQVTPAYMNASGQAVTGTAQSLDNVVGIIFDRDAMGYNVYDESMPVSPYNAKDQYYNLFHHARVQLQNDLSEKIVVLMLD